MDATLYSILQSEDFFFHGMDCQRPGADTIEFQVKREAGI